MRSIALFAVLSFLSVGCGSGPKVTTCISDPGAGGFQCVDPDDKVKFLPYPQTGNYVCYSPMDARTLLEACSIKDSDIVAKVESTKNLKHLARKMPTYRSIAKKVRRDYDDHYGD